MPRGCRERTRFVSLTDKITRLQGTFIKADSAQPRALTSKETFPMCIGLKFVYLIIDKTIHVSDTLKQTQAQIN